MNIKLAVFLMALPAFNATLNAGPIRDRLNAEFQVSDKTFEHYGLRKGIKGEILKEESYQNKKDPKQRREVAEYYKVAVYKMYFRAVILGNIIKCMDKAINEDPSILELAACETCCTESLNRINSMTPQNVTDEYEKKIKLRELAKIQELAKISSNNKKNWFW